MANTSIKISEANDNFLRVDLGKVMTVGEIKGTTTDERNGISTNQALPVSRTSQDVSETNVSR